MPLDVKTLIVLATSRAIFSGRREPLTARKQVRQVRWGSKELNKNKYE